MADIKKYEQALPVGFKLVGGSHNYIIEEVLGQGGFGITYKVKARIMAGNIAVTTHFAVKEFFPSGCWRTSGSTEMLYAPTTEEEVKSNLKDFVAEGRRLQRICNMNANIVKVNEVFEANGTAYFVMEYLSGGDLRKMVKENGGGISEAALLSIITPVAQAIECLHQNDMLHLDIKPENIVMRQGDDGTPDVPVLIDFGIAVHFTSDGSPTTTRPSKGVTKGYSPVEQFAGISHFDPRIDIYALSATCYYLLTGKDPNSAFEITSSEISSNLNGKASERTVKNIIRGMSKNADERPTSISQFIKGFRESVAMAPGTVVRGMYQSYLITAVLDEKNDYVLYRAALATTNSPQNEYATRRIGNTPHATISFLLWERLDNGKRITAASAPQVLPWIVPVERGYANHAFGGQADGQRAIVSEYFKDGNVEYVAMRQDYVPRQRIPEPKPQYAPPQHASVPKTHYVSQQIPVPKPQNQPQVEPIVEAVVEPQYEPQVNMAVGGGQQQPIDYYDPSSGKKSKKPLIILLSVLGAILLIGLTAWIVIAMNSGKSDIDEESRRLDKAIDYEDKSELLEFAEMDSVRAFLPLASIYYERGDYDSALTWAMAAIDSGELSEADEEDANRLIEMINYSEETEYYDSSSVSGSYDDYEYYDSTVDSVAM